MNIAICGKMRSGKDTVANYLVNEYDYKEFKFSSGVTDVIETYFPETLNLGKPREYYQTIGQGFRKLNPYVWITYTEREIRRYLFESDVKKDIVISDLRQQNEYEYLKINGYTVIKIESNEDVRKDRILKSNDVFDESAFSHETELSVDGIEADYTVQNNGSLDELHHKIDRIMLPLIIKSINENVHN